MMWGEQVTTGPWHGCGSRTEVDVLRDSKGRLVFSALGDQGDLRSLGGMWRASGRGVCGTAGEGSEKPQMREMRGNRQEGKPT